MAEKLPQVVEAVKRVCRDPSIRVSCFGKGLCRRGRGRGWGRGGRETFSLRAEAEPGKAGLEGLGPSQPFPRSFVFTGGRADSQR